MRKLGGAEQGTRAGTTARVSTRYVQDRRAAADARRGLGSIEEVRFYRNGIVCFLAVTTVARTFGRADGIR